LPTLSAPNTLRIEPSAYITDEEIDRIARAFEDLARKLEGRQMYELFLPLMEGDPFDDNKGKAAHPGLLPSRIDEPAAQSVQVAFIAHFSRPAEELRLMDEEFSRASDTGLRILFNRLQVLMEMKPLVLFSKNIFSKRIHFSFIVLPLDSAELERLHRLGKTRLVVAKIQEAVELAARRGATVISLGGYTSILSGNGLALAEPDGTRILTGNTLTAASGIYRLTEEIRKRRGTWKKPTLGIVGAAGNIGSIITESLLRADGLFEKVILMDRKKVKLDAFAAGLDRGDFTGLLETATDFRPLKECDIISVSTNTNDPIIYPHHLKDRDPVLISDVSIPSALAARVARMDNVTLLPFASYITLPEDPDFIISSHTPKGTAFCCAAEAMLYGLEAMDVPLKGKITGEAIDRVTAHAQKHRFFEKLGTVESFKSVR
jgi:predicted amino acid dehydrogenase